MWGSVSPCFPLRDLAVPSGTCPRTEGASESLHPLPSPALGTLGTAAPGAEGQLRAQSRGRPACVSSALLSPVGLCTGETWHLSEWIFPNGRPRVYAAHRISPHPCCCCRWLHLNRLHFFLTGKFPFSPSAPHIGPPHLSKV